MRRKPKKLKVFPNPWGVDPKTLFERDPKTGKILPGQPKLVSKIPAARRFTIDPVGRAIGVVTEEVFSRSAPTVTRFVGARLDKPNTFVTQKLQKGDDLRSQPQQTVYSFMGESANETEPSELVNSLIKKEPISITTSPYYIDRIRSGELIAADEETARHAGVRFTDPKVLLIAIAESAVKGFNAQFEDSSDVYSEFCKERSVEKKAAEKKAEGTRSEKNEASETEKTQSTTPQGSTHESGDKKKKS